VSNGILAARAQGTARGGEDTSSVAVRRPLAVAVLAAALTTLAGLIPGRPGVDTAVALNFAAVAVVLVLLLRRASASAHPAGWRWYAASVGIGAGGAALAAAAMPWGQTALGSVPGQLLVVGAILAMLDGASVRAARARVITLLTLFVIGDMLAVHSIYQIVIGGHDVVPLSETVTLFALLGSIAFGTGLSLVLITVGGRNQRRVGGLLFGGQVATALAASFSSVATGPGPVQYLACGFSVLGLGLLPIACRLDRPCPRDQRAADSAVGALLPHLTGLLGGSLLLLSIPLTGRLTLFGMSLGVVGLAALFAYQTVSWHTQRRLTAELQRSEAYFRTLVRGSAEPIVILDEDLRARWVSPSITELLGLDPADAVGLTISDVVHPHDSPGLLAVLTASESDGDADGKTRTTRVRHVDGRYRLIQLRIRDLRGDADVGALVIYCRDVTPSAPQPATDSDLSSFSTIDPCTGLPNRSALTHRLAAILRDPDDVPTSLVMLGVDGLPDGDAGEVLGELTGRISRVLRGEDWLARAAGSEFAVLVNGSIADAEVVAARLVAAVEPLPSGSGTIRLTAAAGVSPLYADVDAGEALRRGDLALRSARAAGPGRVRRHSDALRITQHREEALRADLDRALEDDQLYIVYQPVIDLALHRTVSVEALLRWRHPTYGEVAPGEFVPLAEESALINELGRWVLHRATATVSALPHADLCAAVNISARHVRSGELVPDVLAALECSGLAAGRLILEITESVLLDDEHVTEDLEALRRLGVRIAVDDFGTGWSSLAYLVGLPIDVLKMDRQFLADVETDPQRRALCSSVLHLGTSLGLTVVVEGVETRTELQLLRDMGHRFIQGYLLGRPMLPEALARRLPADDGGTAPGPTPGTAVAPPNGGTA
jgi:PAS domain S-box-containing protein/diguanylate cyclase (GGDEF)-like protein